MPCGLLVCSNTACQPAVWSIFAFLCSLSICCHSVASLYIGCQLLEVKAVFRCWRCSVESRKWQGFFLAVISLAIMSQRPVTSDLTIKITGPGPLDVSTKKNFSYNKWNYRVRSSLFVSVFLTSSECCEATVMLPASSWGWISGQWHKGIVVSSILEKVIILMLRMGASGYHEAFPPRYCAQGTASLSISIIRSSFPVPQRKRFPEHSCLLCLAFLSKT